MDKVLSIHEYKKISLVSSLPTPDPLAKATQGVGIERGTGGRSGEDGTYKGGRAQMTPSLSIHGLIGLQLGGGRS